MQFNNPDADTYVPDSIFLTDALARTTHLGIGAHPDDNEILGYHGISECFNQKDLWYTGVTVTDGASSPRAGKYAEYLDAEIREIRMREQREAADIGKYSCQIQLRYSSKDVKQKYNPDLSNDLQKILEIAAPRVIYLHNLADKHDTHVATVIHSLKAIRALSSEKRPDKVYGCEVWRDLDWLIDSDKKLLPVDKHKEIATSLLEVYDSQIASGKQYDLAVIGRRRAHATFFEFSGSDKVKAITWAIDLTPLIKNEKLSVVDYTLDLIESFKTDVKNRIEKFL